MPDPAADAQAPPGAPVRAEAAVSSVFKALVSGAALGAGRPSFSSLLSGTPTPSSLSSASPSSSGPVDVSVGAGAGAPSAGAESASRPGPSAAKRDMSPAAGPSRSDPDPGGRSTDPVALDDTLQSDLIRYRRTLASTVHACKKLTAERVSLRSALNRLEQLHAGLHRERDRLDTLSANFMESLQAASAGLGIDPAAEQPPADLDGALRQLDESSAASLSALVWNSLQLSHWLQPFVDSLSNAPQPSEPSTPTADSVDSADLEELLQIERTDKAEQILSFQRRLDTARLALAQAEESARASEARAVAAERSAALAEHARSAAESQALGHSMECQRLEAALLESQRNQAAQLLAAQQQIDDLRDQLDSARSPGSPGSPAGETSPGLGPRAGAPAAGGTAAAAARVEANAIVTQAEIQALRTEVRHYREKALRAEREADTLRAQLASTRTDLSALRLEQEHALAAAAGRPASPPPVLAPEPEPAALAAAAALDAERATVSRLTHRLEDMERQVQQLREQVTAAQTAATRERRLRDEAARLHSEQLAELRREAAEAANSLHSSHPSTDTISPLADHSISASGSALTRALAHFDGSPVPPRATFSRSSSVHDFGAPASARSSFSDAGPPSLALTAGPGGTVAGPSHGGSRPLSPSPLSADGRAIPGPDPPPEYTKNVILSFLQADAPTARLMLPAVAAVLDLSPSERISLGASFERRQSLLGAALGGGAGAGGPGDGADATGSLATAGSILSSWLGGRW